MDAGPPPPDDRARARAECHRAGRAQLAHLRKLLAVLDWSAAHMPEPEPEEEPWEPPPPAKPDYDGSDAARKTPSPAISKAPETRIRTGGKP